MKRLAVFVLSLLPFTAFGANWIEYDTKSNDSTSFYDKSSVKIKRFPNGVKYIQVWEKTNYEQSKYLKKYITNCSAYDTTLCNKPYSTSKSLSYYDCWNDKIIFGKSIYYDNNGDVVDSESININENSSYSWSDTVPDTIGEGQLKEICRAYKNYLK